MENGIVKRVIGPVVDVQFPAGKLPEINNAIEVHAGERRIVMEAARRLGKSQSAVANKLRLLKLPQDVRETLRDRGLTERHGRALLRLPDATAIRSALAYIIEHDLNVVSTDNYIDALIERQKLGAHEKPKRTFIMKDVRLFMNTVRHGLDLMKQGGIDAGLKREETDDAYILTISIPKKTE